MGRWDHDDPADEHDINELRNYVHKGTQPQFAGKAKSSGCVVIALVVLAPIGAAIAALRGWA